MTPERLRLVPYHAGMADLWNAFVAESKNGTFLFDRQFMDYHANRFEDASLVAFEGPGDGRPVAFLPATRERRAGGDWLISHAGLSYGGWITDARMTTPGMLTLFELLKAWATQNRIVNLRYKAVPACYHRLPADEDLYALFVQGAQLVRQDLSSVIDLQAPVAWSKGKVQGLSKAAANGVRVEQSHDLAGFMAMLAPVLATHGATPTHSLGELTLLAGRFPQSIRLYAASVGVEAIAYVLVFDTGQTVHTQYMASSPRGRAIGGLEAIIDRLQRHDYAGRRYLSFGISTETEGRVLNEGLVRQKEMFGARAMVCSFYDLPTI